MDVLKKRGGGWKGKRGGYVEGERWSERWKDGCTEGRGNSLES
jgi:hypothetical protein